MWTSFAEVSPCKRGLYSELFWFVFSRIQTEYEEIRSISPYSVQFWENTSQNNSEYGHFLLESEEKRTSDDYILTQKQFSVQTSQKQIQNTRSKHWPNLKTQLGHYKWFKEWQKHRGTGQKEICGNAIKISS